MPTEPDAPAEESVGQAAKTAFGQVRDAIPASNIESAISHVPGGGMGTSAFKAAKGLGGLGIALGTAGASAITKKRRKSKASTENPDAAAEKAVDDTGPNVDSTDSKIQASGVPTSPESPSILKPNLTNTRNENISGYQGHSPASTMYYTRTQTEQGISPDAGRGYVVPGAYSQNDLPPITQYTGVQPYIDENGIGHDDLEFMRNIKGTMTLNNSILYKFMDLPAPDIQEIIRVQMVICSPRTTVVHERVHRVEVEEVTRQIIHDRHIHHIQHHTQPVIVRELLKEKHHEKVHPSTTVFERHVNSADDLKVLDAQVRRHGNTKEYLEPEHFVIDRGSIIQENVHHHIHHIIQPVFEKETMDNHRTHTRIPIQEAIHNFGRDPKSESVDGIAEKDGSDGKRKSVIPDAQLVRSPSIHCKGCKCHEMNVLSESFENTNISESPRQDTGIPGINGEPLRQTSISVM